MINRVAVFHRTNCCQDRLASALIIVSDTPDFSSGTNCGPLTDYSQQPETTQCDGVQGQFVTVSLTGGSSGGVVVTICEAEVWGYMGAIDVPPEANLVEGLPTGGCAFDPCVADGSCACLLYTSPSPRD